MLTLVKTEEATQYQIHSMTESIKIQSNGRDWSVGAACSTTWRLSIYLRPQSIYIHDGGSKLHWNFNESRAYSNPRVFTQILSSSHPSPTLFSLPWYPTFNLCADENEEGKTKYVHIVIKGELRFDKIYNRRRTWIPFSVCLLAPLSLVQAGRTGAEQAQPQPPTYPLHQPSKQSRQTDSADETKGEKEGRRRRWCLFIQWWWWVVDEGGEWQVSGARWASHKEQWVGVWSFF